MRVSAPAFFCRGEGSAKSYGTTAMDQRQSDEELAALIENRLRTALLCDAMDEQVLIEEMVASVDDVTSDVAFAAILSGFVLALPFVIGFRRHGLCRMNRVGNCATSVD